MRRVMVAIAVLVLAAFAWFVLSRDPGGADDVKAGGPREGEAASELETAKAVKAPRKRTQEEIREEAVSEFLARMPEKGQDVPQDPALGAITGVVLSAPDRPVKEGVVETTRRGEMTARARVKKDGSFLLKNVPPTNGIGLAAHAPDYAPGGLDKLAIVPGETLDVGALYLGSAIDPDATNRVEVVVVQKGGLPIAGAQVTATSTLYGALVALGAWEKQPGGTVVRRTTDDKGVALFEKLPPGSYDVFSEAEGMSFEVRQRYLVQRDTQATITLEVEPATSIEGKVVDAEGKPVAKAHVGALRWGNFTMNPATSTDDEGKFAIGGLTGGSYLVFAVREDIGQKDMQNVEAGTKDLAITLDPGAEMALKVTDAATGAPVKTFAVRPFRLQPFAYLYSPHVDVVSEDGTWRQKMAPQSWGVEVTAKGYALKSIPSVPVPTKTPVEVKLERAAVLHGVISAKDGGKPVRGAKVYVKRGGFPASPMKDLQTVSDEKGDFVLDGLANAATTIWISHVDYTEQSFPVEPVARGADGAVPPAVAFALGSGGRIVGHAYGPGRVPLAGQSISVMKGAMDFLSMRNAVVAADGSYEFKNLPPETYRVSVGGGFGGDAKNGVVVPDGGSVTVDFGADSGGQKLAGKVVRADETPVANQQVQLETPSGATQQTPTDAQGRFAFENLAAGKYSVRGAWGRTKTADVVVKAEEPPAEVVLVMLAGTIEGRVVDSVTSAALSGVWIDCEMTADSTGTAPAQPLRAGRGGRQTGADGVFRVTSLEDGRYRLRAYRDPYGTEMLDGVDLAPGETKKGLEIRLVADAGTLSGTVKSAVGLPIEAASLQIKDTQGRRVFFVSLTNSSSDGTYSQGQLKPGEYDATMEKDGFAPATVRVLVETGKPARADFTMLQGGRIEATARLADSNPAANCAVTLLDVSGRRVEKGLTFANIFSSSEPKTDAQGQIVIRGLAPGRYVLKVKKDDGAEAQGAVDVVEGAGAAVEILFSGQ